MAEKRSSVTPEIRRDEATGIVHYGFVQDGVFHSIAAERQGDFDERVAAAKEDNE